MTRGRLILLVKLGIAAGLFAWLISSGRIEAESFSQLGRSWPWFAAGASLYGIVLILAALRWRLLLGAQGLSYPFWEVKRLTLVGWFFNQFLPGSTGGDVAKAFFVARDHPDRRGLAILTVIFDRVLGLIALAWVALLGILLHLGLLRERVAEGADVLMSGLVVVTAGVTGGSLVLGLGFAGQGRLPKVLGRLAIFRPFARVFGAIGESVRLYRERPGAVLGAIAVSAAIHSTVIVVHWCYLQALGIETDDWTLLVLLVPLAQLAMAVPVTPGSLGTAEAAYHHLFSAAGLARGTALCLLLRGGYYLWGAVGGVVYVATRRSLSSPTADALRDEAPLADKEAGRPVEGLHDRI